MLLVFGFILTLLHPAVAKLHLRYAAPNSTNPTVKITVDTQTRHQVIDGFGISGAFQRARQAQKLPAVSQKTALDLLFSKDSGAGFSILRNGIGSSTSYDQDFMKSIEPSSPGSTNATPRYEWDGDDAGQVWFTKEAKARGVEYIYANAWSAPAYMKTNNNDSNGGYICGVREANCTTGDWRQAFANYLIQFLRFYKEKEGVTITHLGFLNEPDLNQTYASMQSSGFQAVDFLKVLRPTLQASEFANSTKIVCCEATGWGDGEDFLAELQSVDGDERFDVYSAHGYSTYPSLPFNTEKKVWQTEWADLNGKWNVAWDILGKEGDGISWANKVHSALTLSNNSAFLYWIGAQETTSNEPLVRFLNGTVIPSKRLWAMAQYSRFVRPEATRVEAKSNMGYVKVSAFENKDGKVVVVIINNGHVDIAVDAEVGGVKGVRAGAVPWTTDNENTVEKGEGVTTQTGDSNRVLFKTQIRRRSMVSFVL